MSNNTYRVRVDIIVRQMIECVRVISKDRLRISFRLGGGDGNRDRRDSRKALHIHVENML